MKPSRDPRQLQDEAATLRERAAGLHRAASDAIAEENRSWGTRRDTAQRDALNARQQADTAHKQANELYEERQSLAERAADEDTRGSRLFATDPKAAEEHFENARAFTRMADAVGQRADDARAVAQDWSERAGTLEHAYQQVEGEPMSAGYRAPELERAADQLDDKARAYAQAATTADPAAASAAVDTGDAITPDYTGIDPAVLVGAGVPLSHVPGYELMTPDDTDALHAGTGATDLSSADQLASHDGTAVFGDDAAAMAAYADDPTAHDDDVVVTDDAGTGFDATALDASYDGASHDIGAYDDGAAFDHAGYDDGAAFDHSGYDDGAAYDHAPYEPSSYDEPAYEHSGYDDDEPADDDAYDFAIDA